MTFASRFMAAATAGLIAAALQTGDIPRPDQDSVSPASPVAGSCSEIMPYRDNLLEVIDGHQQFFNHLQGDWRSSTGSLDRQEIEDIVDDGIALMEDLAALTAPGAYHPGHDGVLGYFQFQVDSVVFYGIDSSTSPDTTMFSDGLLNIYNGERNAAEACPDEVEDVGGYILFSPDELEEVLFP